MLLSNMTERRILEMCLPRLLFQQEAAQCSKDTPSVRLLHVVCVCRRTLNNQRLWEFRAVLEKV